MPSIYDLKPAFQNALRPIVGGLAKSGVTANQVTITAAVMSCAAGAAIYIWPQSAWPFWSLPAALLLRMTLNAVDGMLAREHGMKTRLGAFLNELGDVVSDTGMYLPFAVVPGVAGSIVVAVVVLAIISEMTGVVSVQAGGERRYDGPMGKSDRALVFGVVSLAIALGMSAEPWVNIALAGVTIALVATVVNRIRRGLASA